MDTATTRVRTDGGMDERLEILRMVEAQVVTADEAATLLEALDRPGLGPGRDPRAAEGETRRGGGVIRIRVTETGSSKPTVNIALPLKLIDAGLSIAEQFVPEYLPKASDLREAVLSGMRGSIMDIQDEDNHVEILVE